MPLSEHEQRQFDAIERALLADDPKFANKLRATDPRSAGKRVFFIGIAILLIGVVVLLVGVVLSGEGVALDAVSLGGFLIMLVGATRAYAGFKRWTGAETHNPDGTLAFRRPGLLRRLRRSRSRNSGDRQGFLAHLEERWQRRMDNNGF